MMTRQRPPRTSTIRDVSLALTALLLVAAGPALAQPSHDRSHRGDNRGRNADVRGDDRGRHNAHRPGSEQRSRPPARPHIRVRLVWLRLRPAPPAIPAASGV